MPAAYRVRQFVQAIGPGIGAGNTEDFAARYLPAPAVVLFGAMPRYDRRHAIRVVQALIAAGYVDPDLLAAALLHDAGKMVAPAGGDGRPAAAPGRVGLLHRVAVVLMQAAWPGLVARLGGEQPRAAWRRVYYVQCHHAAIGADLALAAGCSGRTAALIREHESAPGPAADPLLAALRAADNQS